MSTFSIFVAGHFLLDNPVSLRKYLMPTIGPWSCEAVSPEADGKLRRFKRMTLKIDVAEKQRLSKTTQPTLSQFFYEIDFRCSFC